MVGLAAGVATNRVRDWRSDSFKGKCSFTFTAESSNEKVRQNEKSFVLVRNGTSLFKHENSMDIDGQWKSNTENWLLTAEVCIKHRLSLVPWTASRRIRHCFGNLESVQEYIFCIWAKSYVFMYKLVVPLLTDGVDRFVMYRPFIIFRPIHPNIDPLGARASLKR